MSSHARRSATVFTVATLTLAACAAGTPAEGPPNGRAVEPRSSTVADAGGETRSAGSDDDPVRWVLAISVDGLKPSEVRKLGRKGAPNLYRMIDEGATTLNARTEHEATITLPNHTGMVTGRWITEAGGHGVTFNEDNGQTVHDSAGEYVDSVFSVVHDNGGSTRFYAAKDKFHFLDRSWDGEHGAADEVGEDNGADKIDSFLRDDEQTLVNRMLKRLRDHPDDLSFLHLAYPDSAGHTEGWGSPAYVDAVRRVDALVGRILDVVHRKASLRKHANVVLTADHGGTGKAHDDATSKHNYRIPFMVWGVGVAEGRSLYALNKSTRSEPGDSRTTYDGKQPIRNGDLANLVTDLLDLPVVPGSTFNTEQDLDLS